MYIQHKQSCTYNVFCWRFHPSGLGYTHIYTLVKSLQSCLTLCGPRDRSPPGSSVHGILQARILEWVAMPPSRRSSQPRDLTCVSCGSCIAGGFLPLTHQESPYTHTHKHTHISEHWLECNYNKYPKYRKIWVSYTTCNCVRKISSISSQRKFIQLYE